MKIIAIAGEMGAGKDTSATPLFEDGVYKNVKFADPLKNMLRSLFHDAGIEASVIERMIEGDLKNTPTPVLQGKTPRYAMQTLGTEWRDLIGESLWSDITDMKIRACARGGTHGVVITDLRFPHEHTYLRKIGAFIARIWGPKKEDATGDAHVSESFVTTMEADAEIFNLGSIPEVRDLVSHLAGKVSNSNI